MRQLSRQFQFQTAGNGVVEITGPIREWVRESGIREGLLTLHVRHTSASLMVQENADPEAMRDMERFFQRLIPWGDPLFRHDAEGPDDMPAHVRAALTSTTLSLPVVDGRPALGTWQGVYVYEHRRRPHDRAVIAHLLGE